MMMTIFDEVTCSAFIVSSRIVVTVTRCFPSLMTAGAVAAEAIQALNDKKEEIVVIGQDEKVYWRYIFKLGRGGVLGQGKGSG